MIYIVLPVHNRKNITEKFIKCLVNQTYQDFKLILVDDGSTDGTDKMVLRYLPNSEIIYGDGNLWWAGGLQKGYDWLKCQKIDNNDIVLIINDDTEFGNDFLLVALELLDGKKRILLKAWSIDKYSKKKGDGYIKADVDKIIFDQVDKQQEANCASTRGLFLRVGDWFEIGGFYPEKLPHYMSDYEFTIRACRKGYTILCDDKLFLYSDSMETGYHQIEYKSFSEFKSKYFSPRNAMHPIYWISFIHMISIHNKYKAYNILRIIYSMCKKVIKAFFIGLRHDYKNFRKHQ